MRHRSGHLCHKVLRVTDVGWVCRRVSESHSDAQSARQPTKVAEGREVADGNLGYLLCSALHNQACGRSLAWPGHAAQSLLVEEQDASERIGAKCQRSRCDLRCRFSGSRHHDKVSSWRLCPLPQQVLIVSGGRESTTASHPAKGGQVPLATSHGVSRTTRCNWSMLSLTDTSHGLSGKVSLLFVC